MTTRTRPTVRRSAAALASTAIPFDLGWRKATVSADASPKLVYAWERFPAIGKEIVPLLHQHYLETGSYTKAVPLDLNFAQYMQMDAAGVMQILTARDNGVLVGYLFASVGAHLNFVTTVFSTAYMYYLKPAYRRGWNGVHLFRKWIDVAENSGVRVLQVAETLRVRGKHDKRIGVLLKYLGFTCVERSYSRLIGG